MPPGVFGADRRPSGEEQISEEQERGRDDGQALRLHAASLPARLRGVIRHLRTRPDTGDLTDGNACTLPVPDTPSRCTVSQWMVSSAAKRRHRRNAGMRPGYVSRVIARKLL